MDILFLIGRIIYGGYFIYNGINHFKNNSGLSQYAASRGVPMPKYAVYFSGALILFGGTAIILGVFVKLAVLCVAFFLVPVSLVMHNFWKISDPNQKMIEMVNFTKNMALLGGALMSLAILEPWSFSL